MNFLAHFYLSPDTDDFLLGSFLGDFIKGPTTALQLPKQIIQGIVLHRKVDSFTDYHPLILSCKKAFSKPYRRYAGIILDMAMDHFLAVHWNQYHTQIRSEFNRRIYQVITEQQQHFPSTTKRIANAMSEYDWLGSYSELDNMDLAFTNIGERFSHENPLHSGGLEILRLYDSIESTFKEFMIEVKQHVEHEILQFDF